MMLCRIVAVLGMVRGERHGLRRLLEGHIGLVAAWKALEDFHATDRPGRT